MSNVDIKIDWKFGAVLIGGIAIYLYLKINPNAFNVTSEDNIANKTAENIYTAITGSQSSPGEDFYDYTHDENGNVKGWLSPVAWALDKAAGV